MLSGYCLRVCVLDESGSILLPFVGGNNLSKFIISAIFQQERSPQCHTQERGVCVCVCVCVCARACAFVHVLYYVCQTRKHGENKPISSFLW